MKFQSEIPGFGEPNSSEGMKTPMDSAATAPSLSNKGFKSEEPKAVGVASSIGGEGCGICGNGHHLHTVDCVFLKYVPPVQRLALAMR